MHVGEKARSLMCLKAHHRLQNDRALAKATTQKKHPRNIIISAHVPATMPHKLALRYTDKIEVRFEDVGTLWQQHECSALWTEVKKCGC